jgi:predicted transcriptional regulator
VRLAILKILTSAKEVDFNFLLTTLGVTKGNLATHINKLESTGLIEVKKQFHHTGLQGRAGTSFKSTGKT